MIHFVCACVTVYFWLLGKKIELFLNKVFLVEQFQACWFQAPVKKKNSLHHIVHFPLAQHLVTPSKDLLSCTSCRSDRVCSHKLQWSKSKACQFFLGLVQAHDFIVNWGHFWYGKKGSREVCKGGNFPLKTAYVFKLQWNSVKLNKP